jgi:hypothetical protein
MAVARRRKLACFQKTCTGVMKKTIPDIMTTTTTTPTVTSNLTPEELVKLVDVSVASKYDGSLTQFTHIIANDMHNTLECFKTDLHNTLPRQVRSVVQQIQGEAQCKQPIGSPSTPYPGNTSAPGNIGNPYPGNTSTLGNMGTLYLGSTTAPGNTGVFANTSSPHHTRVVLRVMLFMLMLVHHIQGAYAWVIQGIFLLVAYPTRGHIHFG